MKPVSLLPLAALAASFVLPDAQLNELRHVEVEDRYRHYRAPSDILSDLEQSIHRASIEIEDAFDAVSGQIRESVTEYTDNARHALDEALQYAEDAADQLSETVHDRYFDAEEWFESAVDSVQQDMFPPGGGHGGHGGHGRHGHHGHHGHHKSNKTVYELIASSNYTTQLAKLIGEFPDLVKALNSTSANYTIFAPTDRAFKKIPEGAPKPSKKQLESLLSYHVAAEMYPAGRILVSKTIPTLLELDSLGEKPMPQRLSTNIGFRGLTINFFSKVVAVDIFGSNGVIHAVDNIILPPPPAVNIIDLLPGEFSTLEVGLFKTGLLDKLNTTKHAGGTMFAPSNFAFRKLGPKINAFLFSKFGLKYLTALLEYHVVPGTTVYSDAIYKAKGEQDEHDDEHNAHTDVPRSIIHLELPTLLDDLPVGVDIRRYGRLIDIKINAFTSVAVSDAIAKDGVLHVINNVLIPPRKTANGEYEMYDGTYMLSEEEFKDRLSPYVRESSHDAEWSDL